MRFALLLVLAGCAGTAFEVTAPGYRPRARDGRVEVFQRSPPARPYTEVGIITVKDPGSPAEAVNRAVEKAREVGCELVVARGSGGAGGTEPLGGQVGTAGARIGSHPGATIGGEEGGSRHAVFVCGVYTDASSSS